MQNEGTALLDDQLRTRLARALRRDSSWGQPFGAFIDIVRKNKINAFLFGGTLRDLLFFGAKHTPRDLDIVVDEAGFEFFEKSAIFEGINRNRFGGLKGRFQTLDVDIWPVRRTWAFQQGYLEGVGFHKLPETAFFNLDAIVAEIAPKHSSLRTIYESGFYRGIIERKIDYNLEPTDFPELNIVRGFVLAQKSHFHFSNRFCKFMIDVFFGQKRCSFERAQMHHYGEIKIPQEVLLANLEAIRKIINRKPDATYNPTFPASAQKEFLFATETACLPSLRLPPARRSVCDSYIFPRI